MVKTLKQHETLLILTAYNAHKHNMKCGVQKGSEYLTDAQTLVDLGFLVASGMCDDQIDFLFEITENGIMFCQNNLTAK